MDYKFLAGVLIGILITIPVSVVGLYFIYLKISSHVRAIVNEYGRG
uniref:P3a protein n=1 Tax=Stellaria aquatica mottle polerovirus A TaxID=3040039 RepID=A0A9Y1ZCC6_9VIRU|nr:P3a protein [Stellaria aquatica mottle polerovirus A]